MKDSLMLKKYKTENVSGVYNLKEEKTFFGSKLMEIEDYIEIRDRSIPYYDVNDVTDMNSGYQYYDLNEIKESITIFDIVSIKNNNHKISKSLQNDDIERYNTRWKINIDIKNILRQYLFGKIKESRVFRSISYKYFTNNNINTSIYEYINMNILDRYELDKIELYVKYIDIKNNVIYSNLAIKQYDPKFNQSIELEKYKVSNTNLKLDLYLDKLAPINVEYYQVKSSTEYKFDYYYNLYFKKI